MEGFLVKGKLDHSIEKSGQVPVNTAKQSSYRAAVSVSTARHINTADPKPKVNDAIPTKYSYFKAHSPVRRPFNQKSAAKTDKKVNTARFNNVTTAGPKAVVNAAKGKKDNAVKHKTGNKFYLSDYQDIDGGFVAFGGSTKGGKITSKGKIRTWKLDFEDVYFVKELKFNLFSVSQMCDKKHSVLFTKTECLVLSPDFKLFDESQVLLKIPRQDNMHIFDLKNVVPSGDFTCLFAKATIDESNLWHRRLGYINFKTMNKLVRKNLMRGLPSKLFENDHTCVACQKGKQHKASCKTNTMSSICKPLQLLHMDLFGLVIMNEFCEMKGIRREFSVARTPQQNGVAERKNRTLIEAARTMLADSKLPTTFWAEAVNTACYVQNRVLVIKPHNKTPYELFLGRKHALSFMRPFRCPVTILNTIDHLGQAEMNTVPSPQYVLLPFLTFDSQNPMSSEEEVVDDAGKKNGVEGPAKEGDMNGPGEATNTNSTNKLNTISSPVNAVSSSFTTVDPGRARDQSNEFESVFGQDKDANSTYRIFTHVNAVGSSYENLGGSTPVNAVTPSNDDYLTDHLMPDLEDTADPQNTGIFGNPYDDEDVGAEADLNNLETTMSVSPIPITRIHKDYPKEQIIGDINSATQTRRMIKMPDEHAMISYINKQRRTNHKDYQNCLFACFLS
ncbi:ribonuclease H-like domain-containing protein [Tanacetum coccineum]